MSPCPQPLGAGPSQGHLQLSGSQDSEVGSPDYARRQVRAVPTLPQHAHDLSLAFCGQGFSFLFRILISEPLFFSGSGLRRSLSFIPLPPPQIPAACCIPDSLEFQCHLQIVTQCIQICLVLGFEVQDSIVSLLCAQE